MLGELRELVLRAVWALFVLCIIFSFVFLLNNPLLLMLLLIAIVPMAVLFFLVSALHSMMYGRKKVVLVLRRFRRKAVSKAVTGAFRRRLKRCYRLITLYDGTFPRLGPPRALQAAVYISAPLTI